MSKDKPFKKLGRRIVDARTAKGLNQSQLAAEVNVRQSTLSSWELGARKPKSTSMDALAEVLDIDLGWLETGEDPEEIQAQSSDIIRVPQYNIRLSAGGGFVVDEETVIDYWAFTHRQLEMWGLLSAKLMVAEIVGDSMVPTLNSGDFTLVNLSDTDVNQPGIFATWDTSALVIKRVEKIPGTDPVMLRLISDNKHHSAYDVPAEDTRIIGRAEWFIRRI